MQLLFYITLISLFKFILLRILIGNLYMFLIKRLFNKEYATRLGKLKCRKIIQSLNFGYSRSNFKVFKIQ